MAVAVDVERVGAGHPGLDELAVGHRGEAQRTRGADVAIERRRGGTAREEEVRVAVEVAVEGGDTAAHVVLPVAGVGVLDPGRRGDIDEVRCSGLGAVRGLHAGRAADRRHSVRRRAAGLP